MDTKQCKICKQILPVTDFYTVGKYLSPYCKTCHNDKNMKRRKEYRKENNEMCRALGRKHYKKYKKTINDYYRRYTKKIRTEVLYHYSEGEMKCKLCGCDIVDVLSIDHIDGGGINHRKTLKAGGAAIYRWLRKNNYPKGFRVLCRNCNWLEHLKKLRDRE